MDRVTREHAISVLASILTPLAPYLKSDTVQEVMVNGPNEVWVEDAGVIERKAVELDEVQIRSAIEILARLVGKEANPATRDAIIDARIEGLRVAAALSSVSANGSSICIRKHNPLVLTLEDYRDSGALPEPAYGIICDAVGGRKNILVSGGTSSGKTTFLNALIARVPRDERIVTIEDTRELRVLAPNYVALEANEQAGITIRDLVKLALRYRPDRIMVGEVRGPEAFDLMQAMNTGHDGGYATIHANSANKALSRLEALVLTTPGVDWPLEAVKAQIGTTFHYVVQLSRVNGKRILKEILRLDGFNYDRRQYEAEIIFRKE